MAKVMLTIAGYSHELACRDGEEAHFQHLAAIVEEKAAQAARAVGGLTETRMLLFAALLLADETGTLKATAAATPAPAHDPVIAQAVAALAGRIEALAETLEAEAATS